MGVSLGAAVGAVVGVALGAAVGDGVGNAGVGASSVGAGTVDGAVGVGVGGNAPIELAGSVACAEAGAEVCLGGAWVAGICPAEAGGLQATTSMAARTMLTGLMHV